MPTSLHRFSGVSNIFERAVLLRRLSSSSVMTAGHCHRSIPECRPQRSFLSPRLLLFAGIVIAFDRIPHVGPRRLPEPLKSW